MESNKNIGHWEVIPFDRIVKLRHTDMKTWLQVQSNKNMDTGKLTVIQLVLIVRLRHTDIKTWLKVRSSHRNRTRTWTVGS